MPPRSGPFGPGDGVGRISPTGPGGKGDIGSVRPPTINPGRGGVEGVRPPMTTRTDTGIHGGTPAHGQTGVGPVRSTSRGTVIGGEKPSTSHGMMGGGGAHGVTGGGPVPLASVVARSAWSPSPVALCGHRAGRSWGWDGNSPRVAPGSSVNRHERAVRWARWAVRWAACPRAQGDVHSDVTEKIRDTSPRAKRPGSRGTTALFPP